MNSIKTQAMKDIIHNVASTIAAMSKVMSNDIKGGRPKFCCIWIENGSKTAVAFSVNAFAVLKMEAFCEAAENDYNECIELVAGHAGLMPIQYENGYALTTSKFYDDFIAKNGMPITEDGVWHDFEYFDWKKAMPELASSRKAIDDGRYFDPKILCILDKVKETSEFNAFYKSVQERLVGNEEHTAYIAVYPGMVLGIAPIAQGQEAMESDPITDMREEYRFFKD